MILINILGILIMNFTKSVAALLKNSFHKFKYPTRYSYQFIIPSPPLSERKRYSVARRRRVGVRRAATARRINLGGKGNALYPVLSS